MRPYQKVVMCKFRLSPDADVAFAHFTGDVRAGRDRLRGIAFKKAVPKFPEHYLFLLLTNTVMADNETCK